MEKFKRKRISEGKLECAIKSEYEMAEFIQHVAKSWKTYQVWHPFSPEFAYKILHYAEYDPHKAIQLMSDPHFNFNSMYFCYLVICDPPTRKYDNKWKPRDRRGQIPSHPYPSPVTLRSYLSRRQISNYTARWHYIISLTNVAITNKPHKIYNHCDLNWRIQHINCHNLVTEL